MKYAIAAIKAFFIKGTLALAFFLAISPANAQTVSSNVPAASQLVGTVQSSHFSGAVFDDGSGKQSFYRLHDKLPDGGEIIRINKKSIVVKQTDGDAYEMFVVGGKRSSVARMPSRSVRAARRNSPPPKLDSSVPPTMKYRDRRSNRAR